MSGVSSSALSARQFMLDRWEMDTVTRREVVSMSTHLAGLAINTVTKSKQSR